MSLEADWVILSACDTAAGGTPDAEGLSGLARAFLFAGARSLLVSHWSVQDGVAARLIEETVTETLRAGNRSNALRGAMTRLIADTSRDGTALPLSHPTVWAPFQIIGVPQ
jgi:CHAT domain-containing protein